jgi:hypothetical protein
MRPQASAFSRHVRVPGRGCSVKRFEVVDQEPSIQPKKIKDFIAARTELSVKPRWVVVDR